MVQMLAVDVGDDGHDGGEFQERAVAFVGFDKQEVAAAHAGGGAADGFQAASHHDGGIQPGVTEDGGQHGGGGSLAVAAGHGDAELQAHQLGQQLATGNHRNLEAAGFLNLGVVLADGGADHQGLGSGEVGRGVAFENAGAQLAEAVGDGGQLEVGAADGETQVQEHLGDAAHADAADAGEVQVLGLKKHFDSLLFRVRGLLSMKNFAPSRKVVQRTQRKL